MKKYRFYLFLILLFSFLTAKGQLIENDSLITVNSDFELSQMKEKEIFYLIPRFNSDCYKINVQYQYDYYRGEKFGDIPIIQYVKAVGKYQIDTLDINNMDTVITVYFTGSIKNIYYTLSLSKNSELIIFTFYGFNGQKCETHTFQKNKFDLLIVENNKISRFPAYDAYSKITIRKRFH
jgi:hypothetical protein